MNGQPWTLRKLEKWELSGLYRNRLEEDFPSNERPNLPAMHRHLQEGLQEIWVMTDGLQDAAYAVCAQANGIVLVTLLAVYPDRRGGGVGSALLALLQGHYAGQRAIVLEVEDPKDAQDEADRLTRTKRIAFYERNGYRMLRGYDHNSFGVHLLLMAYPLAGTLEDIQASAREDVPAIFDRVLPAHLRAQVTTTYEEDAP